MHTNTRTNTAADYEGIDNNERRCRRRQRPDLLKVSLGRKTAATASITNTAATFGAVVRRPLAAKVAFDICDVHRRHHAAALPNAATMKTTAAASATTTSTTQQHTNYGDKDAAIQSPAAQIRLHAAHATATADVGRTSFQRRAHAAAVGCGGGVDMAGGRGAVVVTKPGRWFRWPAARQRHRSHRHAGDDDEVKPIRAGYAGGHGDGKAIRFNDDDKMTCRPFCPMSSPSSSSPPSVSVPVSVSVCVGLLEHLVLPPLLAIARL